MRRELRNKVIAAIAAAHEQGELAAKGEPPGLTVEAPRQAEHGDWATNAALVMARAEKKPPRDVAALLVDRIDDPEGYIEAMEIAGPGFINFRLSDKWLRRTVREILEQGPAFGTSSIGGGERVQVEFVSANPTGPLHVGHGRGAALGDALARVLRASGFLVETEYYVNDAGRQMQTLGRSVLYRYYQLCGRDAEFPPDHYQGEYIRDLAGRLKERDGEKWLDAPVEEAAAAIYPWAANIILEGIRRDLADFGVTFDRWFSEKSLFADGGHFAAAHDLRGRGYIYEQDGAVWFRSSELGDDKDRVLTKSSGDHTYFATDIAYHRDKFERGLDRVINIWGADHHGYVPRMKAAVQALGRRPEQLNLLLVQLVNLLRGGEPAAMSTRGGQFVTLREVVDEVGRDAARFIFLTRGADSPLDFDLEQAKAQSADNPVYYVQYVHARICSVYKKAAAAGLQPPASAEADLSLLTEKDELAVMKHLAAFPDMVEGAALNLEPHRVTTYLTELAKRFHPYYNRHRFVGDDVELSKARLALAEAVRRVTSNGLDLLGVSAPESM